MSRRTTPSPMTATERIVPTQYRIMSFLDASSEVFSPLISLSILTSMSLDFSRSAPSSSRMRLLTQPREKRTARERGQARGSSTGAVGGAADAFLSRVSGVRWREGRGVNQSPFLPVLAHPFSRLRSRRWLAVSLLISYLSSALILSESFCSRSVSRVREARCSSCVLSTSDLKPAIEAWCSRSAFSSSAGLVHSFDILSVLRRMSSAMCFVIVRA
mmetsp:Transcript_41681/g.98894  ORF Transcript_41681/g.98894 Transcript_41681/m.98894 type:complete len:216 (+) Transcript_41681:367-1014(+)